MLEHWGRAHYANHSKKKQQQQQRENATDVTRDAEQFIAFPFNYTEYVHSGRKAENDLIWMTALNLSNRDVTGGGRDAGPAGSNRSRHGSYDFVMRSRMLADITDTPRVHPHSFPTVVAIASLFLFFTLGITVTFLILCRKKNMVFALQKSEQDDAHDYDFDAMEMDTCSEYGSDGDIDGAGNHVINGYRQVRTAVDCTLDSPGGSSERMTSMTLVNETTTRHSLYSLHEALQATKKHRYRPIGSDSASDDDDEDSDYIYDASISYSDRKETGCQSNTLSRPSQPTQGSAVMSPTSGSRNIAAMFQTTTNTAHQTANEFQVAAAADESKKAKPLSVAAAGVSNCSCDGGKKINQKEIKEKPPSVICDNDMGFHSRCVDVRNDNTLRGCNAINNNANVSIVNGKMMSNCYVSSGARASMSDDMITNPNIAHSLQAHCTVADECPPHFRVKTEHISSHDATLNNSHPKQAKYSDIMKCSCRDKSPPPSAPSQSLNTNELAPSKTQISRDNGINSNSDEAALNSSFRNDISYTSNIMTPHSWGAVDLDCYPQVTAAAPVLLRHPQNTHVTTHTRDLKRALHFAKYENPAERIREHWITFEDK